MQSAIRSAGAPISNSLFPLVHTDYKRYDFIYSIMFNSLKFSVTLDEIMAQVLCYEESDVQCACGKEVETWVISILASTQQNKKSMLNQIFKRSEG